MLIMLVLAWSGQTDLALCSLYMAESECCTNPVYAAVIRTASKQLQLRLELGNLSVNVYMLVQVCTSRTALQPAPAGSDLIFNCTVEPAGNNSLKALEERHAYANGFLLVQTVQNRASCSETPETNAV
jgi:hypothetical protein